MRIERYNLLRSSKNIALETFKLTLRSNILNLNNSTLRKIIQIEQDSEQVEYCVLLGHFKIDFSSENYFQ